MYTNYKSSYENERHHQKQEQLIRKISHRFMTYGYTRIKTPAFEDYDLYSKVNSSINIKEMIKVIDQSGEVLVLRPDVTIPITRQLAEEYAELPHEMRYFYVEDVFRQSKGRHQHLERTQAGIEYYCNASRETDAEVIALAIHILKDLGFKDIKIEMGDAGFFKELARELKLDRFQLSQLKHLVQAKNAVDIERFLEEVPADKKVKEIVEQIPFLYGSPESLIRKISHLALTKKMKKKITHLFEIVDVLNMYGLENHIVLDLGLINHMDYYSDVIFQGFVENVGEPVVMGGRYNQLGNAFNAMLPAIGFACFIDLLVTATHKEQEYVPIDFLIRYEAGHIGTSIKIANELRERNFSVMAKETEGDKLVHQKSVFQISITSSGCVLYDKERKSSFKDIQDLLELIDIRKEEV